MKQQRRTAPARAAGPKRATASPARARKEPRADGARSFASAPRSGGARGGPPRSGPVRSDAPRGGPPRSGPPRSGAARKSAVPGGREGAPPRRFAADAPPARGRSRDDAAPPRRYGADAPPARSRPRDDAAPPRRPRDPGAAARPARAYAPHGDDHASDPFQSVRRPASRGFTVALDPDVARVFRGDASVNKALRLVLQLMQVVQGPPTAGAAAGGGSAAAAGPQRPGVRVSGYKGTAEARGFERKPRFIEGDEDDEASAAGEAAGAGRLAAAADVLDATDLADLADVVADADLADLAHDANDSSDPDDEA